MFSYRDPSDAHTDRADGGSGDPAGLRFPGFPFLCDRAVFLIHRFSRGACPTHDRKNVFLLCRHRSPPGRIQRVWDRLTSRSDRLHFHVLYRDHILYDERLLHDRQSKALPLHACRRAPRHTGRARCQRPARRCDAGLFHERFLKV